MLSSRDVYGKITLHKEYYTPADRVTEAVHAVPRKDNINLNAHTPHAHRDVPARVQGPNTEHKPATARSTGKKIVAGGRNSCIQDPDILEKSRKHRPPKPVKNSERPPWYPLRKDDRIGKHDLCVSCFAPLPRFPLFSAFALTAPEPPPLASAGQPNPTLPCTVWYGKPRWSLAHPTITPLCAASVLPELCRTAPSQGGSWPRAQVLAAD